MVRRYISVVSMRSVTCHSLSSVPDTILWLRRDLRLADHPALVAAHEAASGGSVLPLFVLDPTLWASAGPARRAWLASSLRSLSEQYDGALVIRHGSPAQVLPQAGPRGRRGRRPHQRRVHAVRPAPRRAGPRGAGPRGRRPGGRRHAVRRGPGHADHRRRHAVPGVHPLRPRLARARLAPSGRRPARPALGPPGRLRGPARGRRGRARPAARGRAGRARALARVPRRGHRRLRRAA